MWQIKPHGKLPEPSAGKYYNLAINPRVAKKHGLQLEREALSRALKLREGS